MINMVTNILSYRTIAMFLFLLELLKLFFLFVRASKPQVGEYMFLQRNAYDSDHQSNAAFWIDQRLSPAFLIVWSRLCKAANVAEEVRILDVFAKVIKTLFLADHALGVTHEALGKVDNASSQIVNSSADFIVPLRFIGQILELEPFLWKRVQLSTFLSKRSRSPAVICRIFVLACLR